MGEKVCCCHAVTGAAVVGCGQLIILMMMLSGSGLILHNYDAWQGQTTTIIPTTVANMTIDAIETRWSVGLMKITLAWSCGFCAVWFLSLLILCLSFKYYRPVFVIPNFVALIVAILATLLIGGVLIGRICDVQRPYQTDQLGEVVIVYFIAFLVFAFIFLCVCLFFVAQYHKYLKEHSGLVVPLNGRRLEEKAWE
uniref:Uncharacterized protein n=1 Tax=Plectus sambesii TaxID=2011161 RepID=A0A914XEB4_9BILA